MQPLVTMSHYEPPLAFCMDYNGWFTDCVNGKVSNFPGSDCDTAMGRGECWNEIM